ncbi:hypothetical protein DPMN_174882 [Dreissena polymorpha]|uniref:Uncharacterized protein n=1 Tax=Dreissena polymorpha TaxID=45954 RepID=A0A9D4E801_DREPO|nr:hypothetical protein DPMN_174882 [Dreissena polymorpha]
MEFLPAKQTDKPVLFFVKGQLNESLLTQSPWMELLYQENPKIYWSTDDQGKYAMDKTWDDVSDLILELIADAKQRTPSILVSSENRAHERTPLLIPDSSGIRAHERTPSVNTRLL